MLFMLLLFTTIPNKLKNMLFGFFKENKNPE